MPLSSIGGWSRWTYVALVLLILVGTTTPLVAEAAAPARSATLPTGPADVILATTTSTQDSGLLDVLVPRFEKQSGYHLKPIAVGSGAALKMGERGAADVLLVHSPQAEEEFMASGFGMDRHLVMYNDFLIVGPTDDPAGIRGERSAVDAMKKIAAARATFISRGDDSGTHRLERGLWEQAGIEPSGSWYQEAGTGMGETLNTASERNAYTISDRGTYLALSKRVDLPILVEGDMNLLNIYHVIAVNPARHPNVNVGGAAAWIRFLLAPETQSVIGAFGKDRFGQALFAPCADNACGVEAQATPVATPTS